MSVADIYQIADSRFGGDFQAAQRWVDSLPPKPESIASFSDYVKLKANQKWGAFKVEYDSDMMFYEATSGRNGGMGKHSKWSTRCEFPGKPTPLGPSDVLAASNIEEYMRRLQIAERELVADLKTGRTAPFMAPILADNSDMMALSDAASARGAGFQQQQQPGNITASDVEKLREEYRSRSAPAGAGGSKMTKKNKGNYPGDSDSDDNDGDGGGDDGSKKSKKKKKNNNNNNNKNKNKKKRGLGGRIVHYGKKILRGDAYSMDPDVQADMYDSDDDDENMALRGVDGSGMHADSDDDDDEDDLLDVETEDKLNLALAFKMNELERQGRFNGFEASSTSSTATSVEQEQEQDEDEDDDTGTMDRGDIGDVAKSLLRRVLPKQTTNAIKLRDWNPYSSRFLPSILQDALRAVAEPQDVPVNDVGLPLSLPETMRRLFSDPTMGVVPATLGGDAATVSNAMDVEYAFKDVTINGSSLKTKVFGSNWTYVFEGSSSGTKRFQFVALSSLRIPREAFFRNKKVDWKKPRDLELRLGDTSQLREKVNTKDKFPLRQRSFKLALDEVSVAKLFNVRGVSSVLAGQFLYERDDVKTPVAVVCFYNGNSGVFDEIWLVWQI
jgi:hypothetical protein